MEKLALPAHSLFFLYPYYLRLNKKKSSLHHCALCPVCFRPKVNGNYADNAGEDQIAWTVNPAEAAKTKIRSEDNNNMRKRGDDERNFLY
jgi:hypothetical protein